VSEELMSPGDRARRYAEYMREEATRLPSYQRSRASGAKNPMARCFRCDKTIRKAEVVYRMCCHGGALLKVQLHEECTKPSAFMEVTHDLEKVAAHLREYAGQAREARERERRGEQTREATREAKDRDVAMYVCRLELETDRHDRLPCAAPGCPVKPPFVHAPPSDYAYVRWKDRSGSYKCISCGGVAQEVHGNDECHRCEDWGGCGRDCTLSAVACKTCGTQMSV
jgi:hypothetical protein